MSAVLVSASAAFAAQAGSGTPRAAREFPVPTQQCLQALAAKEEVVLAEFDSQSAQRKATVQAHRDALAAAAAIADDDERKAAMQQARETFRADMQEPSEAMQAAMDAVRDACGGERGGFGQGFGPGSGPMKGMMRGGMHGERRGGPGSCGNAATAEEGNANQDSE